MFTWRDARFAIRSLPNSPGFTALALLTLALGIGANTAIFTLVDAVMFKSLPVSRPAELYRLGDRNGCCVNSGFQNSYSIYPYSNQLYGVSGHDMAVLGTAVAVTVLSAILAAIVPARRAASVDPMRALRL